MDEERIAISEIRNLESVRFSDLGVSSINNSKTSLYNELLDDGNTLIIPMLIVVYDGAKVIVLSSKDENFEYLVKKTKDVYLKEKDSTIEGDFFKRGINIDEYTKKILLSDTVIQTSDLYKYYENIESYDKKLISSDSEYYALLPLIEYVLKTNLYNINRNFKLENKLKGYSASGNYILYGSINEIYTPMPMRITKSNNKYNIKVSNVFKEHKPLDITINFNRTSLDIISSVSELNYQSLETFKYEDNSLSNRKEIYVEDKCVYVDPTTIDESNYIPNIIKLDERDNLRWFKLPWNASIGFSNIETKIDEESKTAYRKIQYVGVNKNTAINIESAEKRFIRNSKDFRKMKDLVFDDVDKTMTIFNDGENTFIETSFSEDGAVGVYRESYANKYFYQVSSANNIEEINNTNTYPVSREYEVYEPGELLNNYEIKKLVKGNK
jgi:hypothetical protein